ncbi:MAG TPA: hypothetical protein VKT80_10515, partial [Chloroflexota bacterium]|nr:hypothetical protein [Chloroflexota bacterium]
MFALIAGRTQAADRGSPDGTGVWGFHRAAWTTRASILSGTYTVVYEGDSTVASLSLGGATGSQTLEIARTCSFKSTLTTTNGLTDLFNTVIDLPHGDACGDNATLNPSAGTTFTILNGSGPTGTFSKETKGNIKSKGRFFLPT